ncbi:unnamed protein product [Echinostoma caproni]|uniref:PDZ domain-containing protein n=1 Tax=Echinostoma caproni TaxID=27848 RepID=A0A3P8GI16_9TREM|nr:unnamed protein product [Echinostoma caproni]
MFQLACSTKARVRQVDFELPPVSAGSSPSSGKLPFSLIGGQDGWGIFVSQVDPRFLGTMGSFSCLSNCSSVACSHQSPASFSSSTLASSRSHLRRADQLLAVNGRSVEHLTPHEVIQLIQSSRSLTGTGTTTALIGSDQLGSSGSVGGTQGTVNSSNSTAMCPIRLLVVFNPVQYHQLVNTLDYSLSNKFDQTVILQSNHVGDAGRDGPRKMTLPNSSSIADGLSSDQLQAVAAACHRARGQGHPSQRQPSQDRRHVDGAQATQSAMSPSGTIRPDNTTRPRSAQTSPTRSNSGSKSRSRERTGTVIGRSGTIVGTTEVVMVGAYEVG